MHPKREMRRTDETGLTVGPTRILKWSSLKLELALLIAPGLALTLRKHKLRMPSAAHLAVAYDHERSKSP